MPGRRLGKLEVYWPEYIDDFSGRARCRRPRSIRRGRTVNVGQVPRGNVAYERPVLAWSRWISP